MPQGHLFIFISPIVSMDERRRTMPSLWRAPCKSSDPDHQLHDDQDLGCCGGVVIHTPGHTPGSVSFWFEGSIRH